MSSRLPSSRVNDTEDQFDSKRQLSFLENTDPDTLEDFFDELPSLLDSDDEHFLGIESFQMARSSQATENSNEDNALNCEAAETSSLGQRTGGVGGVGGILENGYPFDLCAPPQPEQEIETFALPGPGESQPVATTPSSNDDTPKPPPPATRKKLSDPKERSKPAKRRRNTRNQPKRRLSIIAPKPEVQATATATNRSRMPPPPPTTPIAVLGTSRPLNGYSDGYHTHGSVGTQVQFNHSIMNGNMPNNMGHPSMPQNGSFVNDNGNSVNHGIMPQGPLYSVQNHSISQSINNSSMYRCLTPMFNNSNDVMGSPIHEPNAFAPCRSANTFRQHGIAFGGDAVPAPSEWYRIRRRVREMGTNCFAQDDRPSMGGNAAESYLTYRPSRSPIQSQINDTRQGTVTRGSIGWASPMPAPTENPGGNSTGGFSQSPAPGSSPMDTTGGVSYVTTSGSFPMSHMSSSPPDPRIIPRREVGGRRGNDSMFLNDPAGANNTGQNGYHPYPYDHRRFRQGN